MVALQVFSNERSAVIEALPSLQDSVTFFQTESAGPASASLEDMQQDKASDISSDAEDAAAADMDQSDLPAPAPLKHSTGAQLPSYWWLTSLASTRLACSVLLLVFTVAWLVAQGMQTDHGCGGTSTHLCTVDV